MSWLCIGVDVGGTNTDAVILRKKEVLCSAKVPTTQDVTSGVTEAIRSTLKQLPQEYQPNPAKYVERVNIGTTHFVNAVVQRRGLTKVAVLRLCGPATQAIPPLCDFPADLRNVISGKHFFLNGGYQYDCSCITDVDKEEVLRIAKEVHNAGWQNCLICLKKKMQNAHEPQATHVVEICFLLHEVLLLRDSLLLTQDGLPVHHRVTGFIYYKVTRCIATPPFDRLLVYHSWVTKARILLGFCSMK